MTDHPSPWRNPVIWLVIGLPLVAIVAGVGLVVVASRSGGSDAIPDTVRRTAQVQVADLTPDAAAQRERLSAVLRFDAERGLVEVLPVSGRFMRDEPLRLTLAHPARADDDRELQLAPTETGWRAEAALDTGHDWNLRLTAADGRWRLQGRLARGELAAHMHPALLDDAAGQ
ncbi:FixH family protein [Luteimonas sp. RD2P54]|uniref:FixH family protein n=1 Tax=Luteimonas endophytica TaxID=3042023 RepID=A0ABT6J6P2_9GAMM|nr:FixH family protein [Luteimonas endophytica]MDH5822232.1 FixH family protein [Luteimonas endophytica]